MAFTIEDMMVASRDKYRMKLVAGKNGWSNSINWIIMIEDLTIINNFSGKELAVTTGLGFQSEERLMELVSSLVRRDSSGLIINTGKYVMEIPGAVRKYCEEHDFPLLSVPWSVYLVEMIKDLSIRVFLQGTADEQISDALIHAIEQPEARNLYANVLLPVFDTDGTFQVFLITAEDLDKMDTVERRRLGYRIQIYLKNLTHNAHFFYYNGNFVLVINALEEELSMGIIRDFMDRARLIMTQELYVGCGSLVSDITNLHRSYQRALAAVSMAKETGSYLTVFDEMGVYRILYSVQDRTLLRQIYCECLEPLVLHDAKHGTEYTRTLELYLKYSGSIQAVAEAMFTHRNTVTYRIRNIKQMLGCDLETADEKLPYQIACLILHMLEESGISGDN
ncbi:MAG: PucR family transcriptional regulator ligand-binding domain-containing protein [Parasporobacterium sp.]|nr:PucR family transcriptional regulator ligand-binding domain-containing protein [Parasporobacterium sp.]